MTYQIDDPLPTATPTVRIEGKLFPSEFIVDLHYVPIFDSSKEGSIGAILSLIEPPPENYWLFQNSLPPGYPLLEYKLIPESKLLWIKIADEVWNIVKSADTLIKNVSNELRQHVKIFLRGLPFVSRVYDCLMIPSPQCNSQCSATISNQWLKDMLFDMSGGCHVLSHKSIITSDTGINTNDQWLSTSDINVYPTNASADAPQFHGTTTAKYAIGKLGTPNNKYLFGPGSSISNNSRLHMVYGESKKMDNPSPFYFNYTLTPSGYLHVAEEIRKIFSSGISTTPNVVYSSGGVWFDTTFFGKIGIVQPYSYGNDSSEVNNVGVGLKCGVNWRNENAPSELSNWGDGMTFSIPEEALPPGVYNGTSSASPVIAGILSRSLPSSSGKNPSAIQRLHALIMSCDNYPYWNKYIGFGTPDVCKYVDLMYATSEMNFNVTNSQLNLYLSKINFGTRFNIKINFDYNPTIWHVAPLINTELRCYIKYASPNGDDVCLRPNISLTMDKYGPSSFNFIYDTSRPYESLMTAENTEYRIDVYGYVGFHRLNASFYHPPQSPTSPRLQGTCT